MRSWCLLVWAVVLLARASAQEGAAPPLVERREGVARMQCTRRLAQYGLYLHRHCVPDGGDVRLSTMLSNMRNRCVFASSAHDVRGILSDTAKRATDIVGRCANIEPREKVVG